MDATISSVYGHGSLPRINTCKEISRRDSLSSSRTRDSGYNSDPEVALSPLDCTDTEFFTVIPQIPSMPNAIIFGNGPLLKLSQAHQVRLLSQQTNITSSPTSADCSMVQGFALDCVASNVKPHPEALDRAFCQPVETVQDEGIDKWIEQNLSSYNRPEQRVSSVTSLSSSSSCELYTNTDPSDDEQELDVEMYQSRLPYRTRKAIQVIMRKIEVNFCYAAYMQNNGGDTSSTNNCNHSTSQSFSHASSQGVGKRKLTSNDHLHPDDDGDDTRKRRRGSAATIENSETGLKFACPFFKHDPDRYRNRRTCPGPGWPTVHRMKEHLYRAHTQSSFCPRCYSTFDSDSDLARHLRSHQCQVSAPQPIEGIDRETLRVLRKRSPAFRMEEDKWRDVYQLLFPDVAVEDIPSPFYDTDSLSESSRRFRRELLRRIQQELEDTAARIPGPVEQHLLSQVAQIIRRCETDLLSSFDSSDMITPSLDAAERRPSYASTVSNYSCNACHLPATSPSHPTIHTQLPWPEAPTMPDQPVPNTDRRPSYASTASTSSMGLNTNIPPAAAPSNPALYIGPREVVDLWLEAPKEPDQHVQIRQDLGEDVLLTPSGEFINWEWDLEFPA